jgi:hypothetical protein
MNKYVKKAKNFASSLFESEKVDTKEISKQISDFVIKTYKPSERAEILKHFAKDIETNILAEREASRTQMLDVNEALHTYNQTILAK